MFCQGCGKEISDDTKFCPACGRPTDGSTVSSNSPSQSNPTLPKSINNKMLLIIGVAVIVLLIVIIVIIGSKGKDKSSNVSDEAKTENVSSQDSSLSDYLGDWRLCKDIQSNSYAFDYEVPSYLRIESEGLKGVGDGPEIEGNMESWRFVGENIFFEVGTNKIDSYEENGNEYFELTSELYEKGGNGRHDVGIRFYYNNSDGGLVME